MATLQQKIDAEARIRELMAASGLPAPDDIEYGQSCIRCFWRASKLALVIDIDEELGDAELLGEEELGDEAA